MPNSGPHIPLRTPRADLHTTSNMLVVVMDIPGVLPTDLCVRLDRGLLFVDGVERIPGGEPQARVRRALVLQRQVDPTAIQATLQHGVLTLRLPCPSIVPPPRRDLLEA